MIHAATWVKSHVDARNVCGACGNRNSHRIAAESPLAWTATQTAISVQATRSFEITGLAHVVSHRWIGHDAGQDVQGDTLGSSPVSAEYACHQRFPERPRVIL